MRLVFGLAFAASCSLAIGPGCTLSRAGDDAGKGGAPSTFVSSASSATGGASSASAGGGDAGEGGAATTGTMSASTGPAQCDGVCLTKAPAGWQIVDFGAFDSCAMATAQIHQANVCKGPASCTSCKMQQATCDALHVTSYSDDACANSTHDGDAAFGGKDDCVSPAGLSSYRVTASSSQPATCSAHDSDAQNFCGMPVLPIDDCSDKVCAKIGGKACILSTMTGDKMCDQPDYPNPRRIYIDAPAECCTCEVQDSNHCATANDGQFFTKGNCGADGGHMPVTGVVADGACHDVNTTMYAGVEFDDAPPTDATCEPKFDPQGSFNTICCAN